MEGKNGKVMDRDGMERAGDGGVMKNASWQRI